MSEEKNEKLTKKQRMSWVIGIANEMADYDLQDVDTLSQAVRELECACREHRDPRLSDQETTCLAEAIDEASFWECLTPEEKEGIETAKQDRNKLYSMRLNEYDGKTCIGNKAMWQALADARFDALYATYCDTLRHEDNPENDETLRKIYELIDVMDKNSSKEQSKGDLAEAMLNVEEKQSEINHAKSPAD